MCHCLEHASVNSKTPENMTRLTSEERKTERHTERERDRERHTHTHTHTHTQTQTIGMVLLDASYAHVARFLNCTKLMITRLIQRYMVTGRTVDKPRSGRPLVTRANEDRHLHILHLRNRFRTVTSSAAIGLGHVISRHTVRRRLRQHGIRAYRPFRGMALKRQHRLRCLRRFQRWQHLF